MRDMFTIMDDAIGANCGEDKVIRLKLAIIVNMLEKGKPQQHPEETITARHVWLWINFVLVT
jgi:hypothetical protein